MSDGGSLCFSGAQRAVRGARDALDLERRVVFDEIHATWSGGGAATLADSCRNCKRDEPRRGFAADGDEHSVVAKRPGDGGVRKGRIGGMHRVEDDGAIARGKRTRGRC
jgi:hypothetical protein